jgi:hypothetical protein
MYKVKLGKRAAKKDARTFRLSEIVSAVTPPSSCDNSKGITAWGMMLNDTEGDCTCAAVGHGVQVASANSPEGLYGIPDSLVQNLYEKSCGYVPGDPSTDNGGVIIDVLNYVRKNGLGPHVLFGYADPSPGDQNHIKLGIAEFGVVDIGLELPITAQAQIASGQPWDVVGNHLSGNSAPGSWGGHSVVVIGYDANYVTCITWGQLQRMTWAFWKAYCDEAHALLFRIWCEGRGGAGNANLTKMEAALATLKN